MITERIDAITKIPAAWLALAPPAPRSVKIELTGRCVYRCSYCSLRNRVEQPRSDMDWEMFKRLAAEIRASGTEEIGLFYLGESFMAPDLLIKAVKYAKQELEFPYAFLTSNAALASSEIVKEVMSAGLNSLKWSMNYADEEQFERIANVAPKYFHKAIENVKAAWRVREEGGYGCKLYASSIRYDGEQADKMRGFVDEHVKPFVDEWYELPLYGRMTSWSTQRMQELGYEPTAGNQGRLGALREPLPCWACFTEAHIRSDGGMSACCFGADDRYDMADLTKVGFMEGWNSVKFQSLRSAHLKKDIKGTCCDGCLAYA